MYSNTFENPSPMLQSEDAESRGLDSKTGSFAVCSVSIEDE